MSAPVEPCTTAETLVAMLANGARRWPEAAALATRTRSQLREVTYGELWQAALEVAAGLRALGVRQGDKVAMAAESCPDWVICDFGIAATGAVNAAMFPSLPQGQIEQILSDSGSWLLIVGNQALLDTALAIRETTPDLKIVTMQQQAPEGVLTLSQVREQGRAVEGFVAAEPRAEDLASLVYTSGTSGEQKGVMLTHGNFMGNVQQCQQVLHFQSDDVLLSVLPLNHVFERTAGCYLPLACGSKVVYVENLRRLRETMQEVRPTYMILVPRFLESLHEALVERMQKAARLRRGLFFWAVKAGKRRVQRRLRGRMTPPWLWAEVALAERLVLRQVREAVGMDRVKDLVSGAAALGLEVNEFFQALGVEVLEGYGLTESAPVVAVNRPGRAHIGCVGPPLPGVELKLGEQDEILVRGANVMQGYHGMPEATAAALDEEGWLHTGDAGSFVHDGCLKITDRLKDLLVLSNGKNVAPQALENLLRLSPYIAQVVALGDRQAYVTALVVPRFDRLRHWAETQGLQGTEPAELVAEREVVELIRREVRRLTVQLADFEKVRDVRLLVEEFTVESGELTPTQKVKRRVVLERYADVIKDMYG